jgi:polyisoprenoid-binding protein YceI
MRPLALLAPLLLTGLAAQAAPTTYTLSKGHLAVLVRYDRGTLVSGHDHILTTDDFEGSVTWDPEDLSACQVNIQFPAKTLVVDGPGMRERYGLEGETSDGNRESIKDNALGKKQLHADEHPTISFASTGCEAKGEKVAVTGSLTVHGTPATVTALMEVEATDSSFSANGSFDANHADFGMKPYSALLGTLKNDERLTFFIDVEGGA